MRNTQMQRSTRMRLTQYGAFNRECEKIEDNYGGIRKETARFILKDERPLIKKLSNDMDSLRKKYKHVFK